MNPTHPVTSRRIYALENRMRPLTFTRVLAAFLCALAIAAPARAQSDSEAIEQLTKTAQYWQERGREDRAAEAWARVLTADPGSRDALVWLTSYYTRIGQSDVAWNYLHKLKDAHPLDSEIPKLERALTLGERYDVLLEEARSAARAGRRDEAVLKYQELFGGTEPPQSLALEYYQTVGGAPGHWNEAKDGLERLAKSHPKDPHVQLALARHLTYKPETRAEGVKMLERLSSDPVVGKEAAAAWRQSLLWGGGKGNNQLLRNYLATHPGDKEVAGQLHTTSTKQYRTSEISEAFNALNKGEFSEAERRLDRLGARDPEALVGRGILALKRGQFAKARQYLELARDLAPSRPDLWKQALASASFWEQMKAGQTAQDAAKYQLAEQSYLAAIEADPDERVNADIKLAEVYYAWNRSDQLSERIQIIMHEKATDAGGLRTAIQVLVKTEQLDQAIQLNEQLKQLDPSKAYTLAQLRAAVLCGKAARAVQAGRITEAKALLLQARDIDPTYFDAAHDLANLYIQTGEFEKAHEMATKAAQIDPDNPESHMTFLRLMEAQGRYEDALAAIQEMTPEQVTQEVRAMQARLELREEIDVALHRLSTGDQTGARNALAAVDLKLELQPDMAPVVADAWMKAGDDDHAITLLQHAIANNPTTPNYVRLALARLYIRVDRERDALEEVGKIGPNRSAADEAGIQDVRVAAVLQQVDKMRQNGQLAEAAALLKPLAADYPNNVRVLCALGRLFQAGDERHDAAAAFQRALDIDPDNLEARSGAIDNALAAGEPATADRLLNDALTRRPDDPNVHLMAARIWEERGDDGRAWAELVRARELSKKQLAEIAAAPAQPASPLPGPIPINEHTGTVTMANDAAQKFGGKAQSQEAPATTPQAALDKEIEAEQDAVNKRHFYVFSPGVEFRYRAGTPGLGELSSVRVPLAASFPLGWRGALTFMAVPTLLDGGSVNLADPGVGPYYGNGINASAAPAPFEQLTGGVELNLKYAEPTWSIDVGSTPLGFPVNNWQGGIEWHPRWGWFGLGLEVSRRPITDSLLSYAGLGDTLSRTVWGAETRNGGRLDLSFVTRSLLFYLFGDYRYIVGTNVPTNQEFQAGAGIDWSALTRATWKLNVGLDVIFFSYEKNMSFFTFGQGGYFSPQDFVHVGIPIGFSGAVPQVRWSVKVEPGMNWIRESAAVFYPEDPSRPLPVDSGGTTVALKYPAALAPSIDAVGSVLVPFAPNIEGGFNLTLHASNDYTELLASFIVNFGWARQ